MKIEWKGALSRKNHALSSGVGSTGQCKPLPFFCRCYRCNRSMCSLQLGVSVRAGATNIMATRRGNPLSCPCAPPSLGLLHHAHHRLQSMPLSCPSDPTFRRISVFLPVCPPPGRAWAITFPQHPTVHCPARCEAPTGSASLEASCSKHSDAVQMQ